MDRDELLDAHDRNLAAVLHHTASTTPGALIEDDARLLLVSTVPAWPAPYQNGALRRDRSLPPADVLDRAKTFFTGRAKGYCVWISAHTDIDLEEAAVAAGLRTVDGTSAPRMAIEHVPEAPALPNGVQLREVVDEVGRQAYVDVTVPSYADSFLPADVINAQLSSVEALHDDAVRAVVAYDGDEPVAAAMVVMSDDVGGVQFVGTVPSARGRGLAEACTQWTVQAAFDLGARAVVLEASEMGEPVYQRMGFVELSRYRWCYGSA